MGMSETHAWFSVSPSIDVYDATKMPFAFLSQYLNSEKLLIVTHAALHRVAEKISQLEGNCIMIHMTARCGSTLLCQVIQGVNKLMDPSLINLPPLRPFSHQLLKF